MLIKKRQLSFTIVFKQFCHGNKLKINHKLNKTGSNLLTLNLLFDFLLGYYETMISVNYNYGTDTLLLCFLLCKLLFRCCSVIVATQTLLTCCLSHLWP